MEHKELHEKAKEIASFLEGYEYSQEDSTNNDGDLSRCIMLKNNETDARLLIIADWRGSDKLEISGRYPTDRGRYHSAKDWGAVPYLEKMMDSIGTTGKKTAEKIAKDIKTRLLPIYEPLYKVCVERQKEIEAKRGETLEFAQKIGEMISDRISEGFDPDDIWLHKWVEDKGSVDVRIMSSGHVSVTFNYIEKETAESVLNAYLSTVRGKL